MPRTFKTLPRVYVEPALAMGSEIELGLDQTNHVVNVLRLGEGDSIVLFNGRDGAWRADLVKAGKKKSLAVVREFAAAQTPPSDLWYGFAPLKVGRLDYLVQKATEMGAGTIQPVMTRYTQGRVRADKLAAWSLEAAQQCEVLTLPRIAPEATLSATLASWPSVHGDRKLIFADESAGSASPVEVLAALQGQRVGLIVGPEGGFAPEERDQLLSQPFVTPISLGPRILRADTAAVAALAVIQATIGDWR